MKLEKTTAIHLRPNRRRYDDACAATHAMDIIGERWALPVMRELMLGPRRFGELKSSLGGISANVLTQRLEGLEAAGVVSRRQLPPPASVQVYELTPWGYEAGPIFQAMGRWAVKSPAHDPARPFTPVSLMLAFRTMADPQRVAALSGRIDFLIGEERFGVRIKGGQLQLKRGSVGEKKLDLLVIGSARAVAAAAFAGEPVERLEVQGELRIEGDRRLASRFFKLFPLPEKATVSAA